MLLLSLYFSPFCQEEAMASVSYKMITENKRYSIHALQNVPVQSTYSSSSLTSSNTVCIVCGFSHTSAMHPQASVHDKLLILHAQEEDLHDDFWHLQTVSSPSPSGAASCDIKTGFRQPSSSSHPLPVGGGKSWNACRDRFHTITW